MVCHQSTPGKTFGKKTKLAWKVRRCPGTGPCSSLLSLIFKKIPNHRNLKEDERVQIFYVNFISLLAGVFYKTRAYAEYMLKLHSLRPSSINKPWRLCANICRLKGGSDETEEKYCLSFASTAS